MIKNKKIMTLIILVLFSITLLANNNTVYGKIAKYSKYNVDINKKIVIKKGKKAKVYTNTYNKIKWNTNSKKIKVSKSGIITAKKSGKFKVIGKTKKGKKITVKVTVKKKFIKPSSKTLKVYATYNKSENAVEVSIVNKSDECLRVGYVQVVKEKQNGKFTDIPKKQVLIDTYPPIHIAPGETCRGNGYSLDNYETHDNMIGIMEFSVTIDNKLPYSNKYFMISGQFSYKK